MKRMLLLSLIRMSVGMTDAKLRNEILFNSDWKFLKSDPKGAEKPDYDDLRWMNINLPHDWSVEGPYGKGQPKLRGIFAWRDWM